MKNTFHPAKPDTDTERTLPFLGLGHVLADVRRVAATMRLRRTETPPGKGVRHRAPPLRRHVSGYGLLVALGREIRGR
ncbi:hypothetical protein [Paucidesulfovibrio longus]|uniref:hypothetical protein n=1 Tax=Paucidesulfovibrio longus TaxID=889 RepID=UPI0003B36141|nr:hypothetical protein [Paucidesulfovibrio longus]